MKRQRELNWPEIERVIHEAFPRALDLGQVCVYLRLERAGWMGYPPLKSMMPKLAAQLLAMKVCDEFRISWYAAFTIACDRLGLNPGSVRRQIKRGTAETKKKARQSATKVGDKSVLRLSRDFRRRVS